MKTLALPPGSGASAGPLAAGRLPSAGRAGADYAVDRLVDSAVAAEREHQAVTGPDGSSRQSGRVAPVPCFHDRQFHGGRQRPGDDIPAQPGR